MTPGDRVMDRLGNRGRVAQLYDDFTAVAATLRTMTGEEWLAEQEVPFLPRHLTEVWARVDMDDLGCIVAPLSCLALLREDE